MYEVLSTTRAGRPRRALLGTAVLFLLTTLGAGLLARHKGVQAEILFGKPQFYRALSLRASFPDGWDVSDPEKTRSGRIIVATPVDSSGRRLLVFRQQASPLVRGHMARVAAIVGAIRAVDPEARIGDTEREAPGSFGSLPSEIYILAFLPSVIQTQVQYAIANVAATPDGEIVGALLVIEGQPTARDRRLLEKFSQAASYQPGRALPSEGDELDEPAAEPQDDREIAVEPLVAADLGRRCPRTGRS